MSVTRQIRLGEQTQGFLPAEQVAISWKIPVRAASTANGTIATAFENGDSLDGVTLATGDRILLKNQTAGAVNGIYTVNASGAPTRAADFDASADVLGAVVFVSEGTANADKIFVCTNNATITLGTTALVFADITGSAGAPTTADYLVGTAQAGLSAEVVVGTTPGGELGGTWAAPTVDATHSGSAHHAEAHTHTAGDSAKASGSGDVTTTSSLADVTGATLSLAAGTYIVIGHFDVLVNNALNDRTFEGHLDVGTVDENDYVQLNAPGLVNVRATLSQVWRVTLGSTTTVKLRTLHSGGTVGDFTVKSTNTTIAAFTSGGSLGAWTTFTPTLTASVTNPTGWTLAGRYKLLDSATAAVIINCVRGGGATNGSGTYTLGNLPFTTSARIQTLPGWIIDSGTAVFAAFCQFDASTTATQRIGAADGAGSRIVSNTVPMTWASGDGMDFQGIMEVAP